MELTVKEITFPEVIEFNYDELKAEITARTAKYTNLVYSEEQINDAKKDLANLRKFTKALSDERIKVKNDCLKAYEPFETKIKELSNIVEEHIKSIDTQVKNFETAEKEKKKLQIESFFIGCNPYEWLKAEQIFNEKWLNKSVKMETVKAEINEKLQKIVADLETLSNLPEFGFEAEEIYKSTLDMNNAISEGKRLAEIQKRKAEATATPKIETKPEPISKVEPTETIHEVELRAYMTVQQMKELKQFFEDRNINFERI